MYRNTKFLVGMTAGAIIGSTVGTMMNMDRSTKRKIKKFGKNAIGMANDMYSRMNHYTR